MLLVTALVVALGLTGAALSKNKPGKPPHHPKGPGHHQTYAWHDVPIAYQLYDPLPFPIFWYRRILGARCTGSVIEIWRLHG